MFASVMDTSSFLVEFPLQILYLGWAGVGISDPIRGDCDNFDLIHDDMEF